VLIFRPHNVYGPDMGWEHVIPQLVLRLRELCASQDTCIRLPIQGSGRETRAFVHIDDFTDGLAVMLDRGEHLEIYNIGSTEEVSIAEVAKIIGFSFQREVNAIPGPLQPGSPLRMSCFSLARASRRSRTGPT
jgi:nucleoside-diphosphate-sugar epimerase